MGARGEYVLRLAKQDFQFAAAHFTLFPDGRAELLHGHNFRVRVFVRGAQLGEEGLLCDLRALKQRIRACCAELDERTLLPEHGAGLEILRDATHTRVHFGARRYQFPNEDVRVLPLANISIELLARFLWEQLAPALDGDGAVLRALSVEVEESAGQSARYAAELASASA